jgi:hypothetical protein
MDNCADKYVLNPWLQSHVQGALLFFLSILVLCLRLQTNGLITPSVLILGDFDAFDKVSPCIEFTVAPESGNLGR